MVGQLVVAIGNPLGFQRTVTAAWSAPSAFDAGPERPAHRERHPDDAAINPGNSGGPLADATARVVGINTAIIGGAQGMGFAVPVSGTFRRVVFTLVTEGRVRRAYLGVVVESRQDAAVEGGAGVRNIAPNSPAERRSEPGTSSRPERRARPLQRRPPEPARRIVHRPGRHAAHLARKERTLADGQTARGQQE